MDFYKLTLRLEKNLESRKRHSIKTQDGAQCDCGGCASKSPSCGLVTVSSLRHTTRQSQIKGAEVDFGSHVRPWLTRSKDDTVWQRDVVEEMLLISWQ